MPALLLSTGGFYTWSIVERQSCGVAASVVLAGWVIGFLCRADARLTNSEREAEPKVFLL